MKFCSACASKVEKKIPNGDNRERFVCISCEEIHYQNPKIVAGALVTKNDQVLLCRRAIEPRKGYWTLPAGYMENNESTQDAAARETWEEAEAKISSPNLYQIYNVPQISQVYFFYRATLDGDFGCGDESLETRLFSKEDIPWSDLAFSTIFKLLERWVYRPDSYEIEELTIIDSRSRE